MVRIVLVNLVICLIFYHHLMLGLTLRIQAMKSSYCWSSDHNEYELNFMECTEMLVMVHSSNSLLFVELRLVSLNFPGSKYAGAFSYQLPLWAKEERMLEVGPCFYFSKNFVPKKREISGGCFRCHEIFGIIYRFSTLFSFVNLNVYLFETASAFSYCKWLLLQEICMNWFLVDKFSFSFFQDYLFCHFSLNCFLGI